MKISRLIQDKFDDHYRAIITINNIDFESISIWTLEQYSKKFEMSIEELKQLIKN